MNKIFENIEIFDTAYNGYGVGKTEEGQIIFIPYTVTGDIVDVKIVEQNKSYIFGKIKQIRKKSLKRQKPKCEYFTNCGGCHFMHIDYEEQVKIKEQIILSAFRNIENFKINKTFKSNPERYRHRAKFKIKNKKIGFYRNKTNDFVEIEDCLIIKESIVENAKSIVDKLNKDISDIYIIENDDSKYIFGIENEEKSKELKIKTRYGEVLAGNNSFFQSNRYLLEKFQETAISYVNEIDKVLELYCGSGFFTIGLDKKAEKVIAVEFEGASIKLAEKLNLKKTKFIKGNVDKILNKNKLNFDCLFVDPPRAGLSKNLIKYINKKLPKKIIYVSCNPITMARDINKIKNNYEIKNFDFFDMFPHTYHIESICVLSLKND